MDPDLLIEIELTRNDWFCFREISGPATAIPGALRELIKSWWPVDVDQAYWKLENHVVVQDQLYESAAYVVPVLLAGLAGPDRSFSARTGMLDLLFCILNGETSSEEEKRGLLNMEAKCRIAAGQGLWLFYQLFMVGHAEIVLEILELIEKDAGRLAYVQGLGKKTKGSDQLVECELTRHDWSHIREADGPATAIPDALRELLAARSAETLTDAYWKLENHIVVQGQLYEAAAYVVPVLLAALTGRERARLVRAGILELLFQIIRGAIPGDELNPGRSDLESRCRTAARQGLWLVYQELIAGHTALALKIIDVIDDDEVRLARVRETVGAGDRDSGTTN